MPWRAIVLRPRLLHCRSRRRLHRNDRGYIEQPLSGTRQFDSAAHHGARRRRQLLAGRHGQRRCDRDVHADFDGRSRSGWPDVRRDDVEQCRHGHYHGEYLRRSGSERHVMHRHRGVLVRDRRVRERVWLCPAASLREHAPAGSGARDARTAGRGRVSPNRRFSKGDCAAPRCCTRGRSGPGSRGTSTGATDAGADTRRGRSGSLARRRSRTTPDAASKSTRPTSCRAASNRFPTTWAIALARRLLPQGTSPPTSPVTRPRSWLSRPTRPTTLFSVVKIVQTRLPKGAAESPEMSMETGRVVTWRPRRFRFTAPISRWSA